MIAHAIVRTHHRLKAGTHDAHRSTLAIALLVGMAGMGSCFAAGADYRVIADQNLFDPQRKPWAEPAAAPAAATPLGPEDIQVQGVVVHGGVKRALIRLGGRLRQLAPGAAAGRFNTILGEGQAVGEYTLESVQTQQLVFVSGGNRYTVALTRNARRETAPSAPLPVIQSATLPVAEPLFVPAAQPAPAAMPSAPPQPFPAPAPAPAPAQFPGVPAQPATGSSTAISATAPVAAPAATPTPAAAPASGMSLLEAIQAAEAARRSGQLPAAPPFNPFLPRPQP